MKINRRFLAIFVVLVISVVFIIFFKYNINNKITPKVPKNYKNPDEVDLTFSVLGDIHCNSVHFKDALDTLYSINPKMNALVLNGDTVDEGTIKDYSIIKKSLVDNKKILPKYLIKNIGNHEFFDYNIKINTSENVKTFINRYLEFSGESKVYHDKWINGYHFISLGSEDGNSNNINSVKAYISEEQLKWLNEKLKENYLVDKPIFVFLHQNLFKSSKGWIGVDNEKDIDNILKKYPEVIMFNSHTHQSLENVNIIKKDPYAIFNTGAVKYTILYKDGKIERVPYNQGIYVEVKGNIATIKGEDFTNRKSLFQMTIKK